MLYSFLLPEVEKQSMRNRGMSSLSSSVCMGTPHVWPYILSCTVRHQQRRHLLAAHRMLHQSTEDMLSQQGGAETEEDGTVTSGRERKEEGLERGGAETAGSSVI